MSLMNLFIQQDPVFSILNDVLQANILKVPEGRIVPLGVVEKPLAGKPKFRTTIGTILTEPTAVDIDPAYLETKPMVNISGEKTKKTDLKLGLEILGGFLKGFGVSLPNLDAHFRDVAKVSFSFDHVNRTWMDNGILADELEDQRIRRNALTEGFFGLAASRLLLIDSVITSNDFSIHASETTDDGFEFNLSALKKEIGSVDGKFSVRESGKRSLVFQGEENLPFAFTCIRLQLNRDGHITGMPNYTKPLPNLMGGSGKMEMEKEKLSEDGGMVEIDFPRP